MADAAQGPQNEELESANEKLVNDFCNAWSRRDIKELRPFLAEDLLYQIAPGQPLIKSRDELEERMGAWLASLETVRWDILRSHVIGPVVLNERIDYFNAPEGGQAPSMRFHIVGHFFVEDGVIKVWKDCPIPGAEQIVG